jgi:hypothetical protein
MAVRGAFATFAFLGATAGVMGVETYLLRKQLSFIYEKSSSLPVERAFGLVLLINGLLSCWVITSLGFAVSRYLRTKFSTISQHNIY